MMIESTGKSVHARNVKANIRTVHPGSRPTNSEAATLSQSNGQKNYLQIFPKDDKSMSDESNVYVIVTPRHYRYDYEYENSVGN